MKLYKWIDFCLDSETKRKRVFCLGIILYWLIQLIWQLMVFFQLILISNYESLLNFASTLDLYTSSVLFRFLMFIISNKEINIYILFQFHFFDVLMLFLTGLYIVSFKSKNAYICSGMYLITLSVSVLLVFVAYFQETLLGVIVVLKGLGIFNCIVDILLILFMLSCVIELVNAYKIDRNVHEL
ncbi:hypothetical protein [Floccifex sp.]|uniref:hypothetical protein n=1 Tax=Floccifex sp. TaxID=2815810 RepID=UPI003F0FA0E6